MDAAAHKNILEAFRGSNEGRLHFGQVIGLLSEADVESYFADYRSAKTTYYLTSGESLGLDMEQIPNEVGIHFDGAAIKSAIIGAQQSAVLYPEFKRLSSKAGCIGYMVWIAGNHVTYFGRKGETHIEPFPGSKSSP